MIEHCCLLFFFFLLLFLNFLKIDFFPWTLSLSLTLKADYVFVFVFVFVLVICICICIGYLLYLRVWVYLVIWCPPSHLFCFCCFILLSLNVFGHLPTLTSCGNFLTLDRCATPLPPEIALDLWEMGMPMSGALTMPTIVKTTTINELLWIMHWILILTPAFLGW